MKCAVTGGSGCLGARIVALLLSEECPFSVDEVRVLDVRPPRYEEGRRVDYVETDVRSLEAVLGGIAGCDIVFHAAAVVDWGRLPDELVHSVNVEGTRNILKAAEQLGVPNVVFTSTMDVAWEGKAIPNGNEELPFATTDVNAYCSSKIIAERFVAAQGRRFRDRDTESAAAAGPATVIVRPMGIYGEGDPYHCSQTLLSAQAGKLTSRMGDGTARFSHVYADNCAWGHICAAAKLLEDPQPITGEAFLIGDDTPNENFFDFMETFITGLGYSFPARSKSISFRTALWIARVSEGVARLVRPIRAINPVLNTDSVRMLCLDFVFSDEKAREMLDYRPIVDPDVAMKRTIDWFRANGPVR